MLLITNIVNQPYEVVDVNTARVKGNKFVASYRHEHQITREISNIDVEPIKGGRC